MPTDNIVSFRRQQHRSDARAYEEAVRAQQVEPWGPVRDYPERGRFVRPITTLDMASWSGDPNVKLYRSLEEQERIARVQADVERDLRVMRWQSRIKWLCIALAYALIGYFAFQLGRGVL